MDVAALLTLTGARGARRYTRARPGALRGLPMTRAQVSTRATRLLIDGVTFEEVLADVPRFHDTARRLRIEGQRTNGVRNPRFEGGTAGVIGSGGVLPTFTSAFTAVTGMTRSVAVSTHNGLPEVRLGYSGTPSAATEITFYPDSASIAATTGTTVTASVHVRLVAGAMTGATAWLRILEYNGGAYLRDNAIALSPTATQTRRSLTVTTGASTTVVFVAVSLYGTAGQPLDPSLTLGLAGPQVEVGAFASTPILPPVGSPAASTRGADLVSATLASLGIGANGACTIFGSVTLAALPPAGSGFCVAEVNAGSTTDRFSLYVFPDGTLRAARQTAGAYSDTTMGSVAAGTTFRFGLCHDGAGRVAGSLNGAAVAVRTGAPTSNYTQFRVGSNAINGEVMFGEVESFAVFPGLVLADAELAARVAGFR